MKLEITDDEGLEQFASRDIALRSNGWMTLMVGANFLTMSPADRAFVFRLCTMFDDYDLMYERAELDGSPEALTPPGWNPGTASQPLATCEEIAQVGAAEPVDEPQPDQPDEVEIRPVSHYQAHAEPCPECGAMKQRGAGMKTHIRLAHNPRKPDLETIAAIDAKHFSGPRVLAVGRPVHTHSWRKQQSGGDASVFVCATCQAVQTAGVTA